MYTLPEMFKLSPLSGTHLPRDEAERRPEDVPYERGQQARARHRDDAKLPWKFALPLIVALSLALWAIILFAAERLIAAII